MGKLGVNTELVMLPASPYGRPWISRGLVMLPASPYGKLWVSTGLYKVTMRDIGGWYSTVQCKKKQALITMLEFLGQSQVLAKSISFWICNSTKVVFLQFYSNP